jgi:hypothetical protein
MWSWGRSKTRRSRTFGRESWISQFMCPRLLSSSLLLDLDFCGSCSPPPHFLYYGFDLSQVLSLGLVLWIHPDLLWIWVFSCSYLDFWGRGLIWMRVRAMHYTAAAWSSEREWPGKNWLKIDVARISSRLSTKHSFTNRYVWILIKL